MWARDTGSQTYDNSIHAESAFDKNLVGIYEWVIHTIVYIIEVRCLHAIDTY